MEVIYNIWFYREQELVSISGLFQFTVLVDTLVEKKEVF